VQVLRGEKADAPEYLSFIRKSILITSITPPVTNEMPVLSSATRQDLRHSSRGHAGSGRQVWVPNG